MKRNLDRIGTPIRDMPDFLSNEYLIDSMKEKKKHGISKSGQSNQASLSIQ